MLYLSLLSCSIALLDRAERHEFWSRFLLIFTFSSSLFCSEGREKGKVITKVGVKNHAFLLDRPVERTEKINLYFCDKKRLISVSSQCKLKLVFFPPPYLNHTWIRTCPVIWPWYIFVAFLSNYKYFIILSFPGMGWKDFFFKDIFFPIYDYYHVFLSLRVLFRHRIYTKHNNLNLTSEKSFYILDAGFLSREGEKEQNNF